jgi:nitrous oxidase accessory protein
MTIRRARWHTWWLCCWATCFCVTSAQAALPPLQALIDATPAGGTLRPPAGRYAGPAVIGKPLTLDGGGRVTLDGGGRGTVLSVRAGNVSVRGMHLTNSGATHDGVDAGLLIDTTDGARVENHVIDQILFGIHLKQANHALVRGNTIRGRAAELNLRGDGIRLWNSHFNQIENNQISESRDLTVANSNDNRFTGNRIVNGRYGMQLIFSSRNLVENNLIRHTTTGIAVLYSDQATLRGNRIEHVRDVAGAGLAFKGSSEAEVVSNTVLHCTVGVQADTPPYPEARHRFRNNLFAHNVTGMFFYGEKGGHIVHGNRFEKNLMQVGVSGPTSARDNDWRGNYWDDYEGFDRNGDGIGDTPYALYYYADRIWMETPKARFFRNSPALELLDFLERLAPFSLPELILSDPQPRWRN